MSAMAVDEPPASTSNSTSNSVLPADSDGDYYQVSGVSFMSKRGCILYSRCVCLPFPGQRCFASFLWKPLGIKRHGSFLERARWRMGSKSRLRQRCAINSRCTLLLLSTAPAGIVDYVPCTIPTDAQFGVLLLEVVREGIGRDMKTWARHLTHT